LEPAPTTTLTPPEPGYVTTECDSVASPPIVIAPSDVAVGALAIDGLSATSVTIKTSPLVAGSAFTVFALGQALIPETARAFSASGASFVLSTETQAGVVVARIAGVDTSGGRHVGSAPGLQGPGLGP
jgi:hypothetical protein